MNEKRPAFRPAFAALPLASRLTVAGLVACALALWTQWLSGDPAYPSFPPGPVIFIAVAALVAYGGRWWWTPLIGALVSCLTTSGWFVRLPAEVQRLTHPSSVGRFGIGIFLGTLLQIVALATADVAGIVATAQNFRRRQHTGDGVRVALRVFGALFVLIGMLVIVGHARVDPYHNLMHLTWGLLAVGASFAGTKTARYFSIASGVFYLSLGLLGIALGNPAHHFMWYVGPIRLQTGDDIFHMVLGAVLSGLAMVPARRVASLQSPA